VVTSASFLAPCRSTQRAAKFGGGGGLADTGRPDQRVDATSVDNIALAVTRQQASIGTSLDPGQRLCGIEIARQIGKQVAGELCSDAK
jgi:hypothetical protein